MLRAVLVSSAHVLNLTLDETKRSDHEFLTIVLAVLPKSQSQ